MDKAISTEELAELQQYKVQENQLHRALGEIYHQRRVEEDRVMQQWAELNREQSMLINRLKRKYEIPDNAQISLDTGAIVE